MIFQRKNKTCQNSKQEKEGNTKVVDYKKEYSQATLPAATNFQKFQNYNMSSFGSSPNEYGAFNYRDVNAKRIDFSGLFR